MDRLSAIPMSNPATDEAALSSVLAEVIEAMQESVAIRLDLMQERAVARMKRGTIRLVMSLAGGASLLAAWIGVQVVVGLWLTAHASSIVAAASLTAINAVVAVLLLVLAQVGTAAPSGDTA
jgi:hypothetical protein